MEILSVERAWLGSESSSWVDVTTLVLNQIFGGAIHLDQRGMLDLCSEAGCIHYDAAGGPINLVLALQIRSNESGPVFEACIDVFNDREGDIQLDVAVQDGLLVCNRPLRDVTFLSLPGASGPVPLSPTVTRDLEVREVVDATYLDHEQKIRPKITIGSAPVSHTKLFAAGKMGRWIRTSVLDQIIDEVLS